jgi:competence ComEA-like helix-hairpin-helix protein
VQNEPDEKLGGMEAGDVKPVDLNLASAEELEALRGIGPELASRIVEYRSTKGPFLSTDELLAIPGIGPVLLGRLGDRLTVTSCEGLVLEDVSEDAVSLAPEVELEALPPAPEEPVAPPASEAAEPMAGAEEPMAQAPVSAALEGEPAPAPAVEAVQPAAPQEQPEPAMETPPVRQPARPGRFQWLWGAILGTLLGTLATLLIFWALNGSLLLSRTPVIMDMDGRVAGLSTELGDLQGELGQVQERLQVLESLPGRMDTLEGEMAGLGKTVAQLEQQTKALQNRIVDVEKGLTAVRERTTRVETFFDRLQALLTDVFGQPAKP